MSNEKDSYKILVIDDDQALLESISLGLLHLSDLDLVTVTATDGVEGLELCEKFDFDAVITDYFMPNMDGMEFIKQFRNKFKTKIVPVIFTSGFFSELELNPNKHLFNDVIFIDKPFEISKINSFLKLYLKSEKLDLEK
ncbi:MAG: response regulator [Oligoflexales bacterium]